MVTADHVDRVLSQNDPVLVPAVTSDVPVRPAEPLADRLRAGDPDACREMIDQHAARMLRVLLRLRGDHHEAEDLLQETWIAACQAAREFRGEASLQTWLERIARNAAAMADRRRLAVSRGSGVQPLRLTRPPTDDEPGDWEIGPPTTPRRPSSGEKRSPS